MKSQVIILSLFLFLLVPTGLSAQYQTPWQIQNAEKELLPVPEIKSPKPDRVDFRFSAGTSFITAGKQYHGMSTYFAPEISYKLNPRFRINTGLILSSNDFSSPAPYEAVYGRGFNNVMLYAEGEYLLNERVSLSGRVVKELASDVRRPAVPGFQQKDFQSISMRVNYKITDNIHIGAQISVVGGESPFYGNNGFYSPYNNHSSYLFPWGP